MTTNTTFEICSVPEYKIKYELTRKINKGIEQLCTVLNADMQLHERLHKGDMLKLCIDVDKLRKHQPEKTIEHVMHDMCDFFQVDIADISHTTNHSVETGSHHLVIPSFCMESGKQKLLWKDFQAKYNYGKEIDAGIFDKEGWFRLPNQTKEGIAGTQHEIQRGCMSDFVLKYIPSDCLLYEPVEPLVATIKKHFLTTDVKPLAPIAYVAAPVPLDYAKDLARIEQIVREIPTIFEPYTEWMNLCFAIYNACNGHNDGYVLWNRLCRDVIRGSTDPSEPLQKWNSVTSTGTVTLGTLEYLHKKHCVVPVEVRTVADFAGIVVPVRKSELLYINAHDLTDPYKVAMVISDYLKATLVLCKENWYMLTAKQLWKQQNEPSYYITTVLRKYIDASNKQIVTQIELSEGVEKEKSIELSKLYLKSYNNISKCGFLAVLTKYLKTTLSDDSFAAKLDTNSGKMSFQNGIMDLKTKVFRSGIRADDFITDTIQYNYLPANNEKKQFVKEVLKKILNNNDEHLEYILGIIGFCFIGLPQLEKSIYFCVDNTTGACGDNGKTFLFDILTHIMPYYVYKSKGTFLEEGNTKVHKQLVMMKGKRLVWVDEYGKKKCNSELMKEIGDGLNIENEIMFGTSEVVNIQFKLFNLTNNLPSIDPKDTAVYNRYKQISYGSHFDRTGNRLVDDPDNLLFIANTSLGDLFKSDYYNEIFEFIIDYAHKYYVSKIPKIPEQFINDTRETQINNDPFRLWFTDNCVVNKTARVALKKMGAACNMSDKEIKEGMTRMGYQYDKDLSKLGKDIYGKHYKGGFIGCDLVEILVGE